MLWHDAFYRFVSINDPEDLKHSLHKLCLEAGVLGSILLAKEGINGMLAGPEEALQQVRDYLEQDTRFTNLFYKRTSCKAQPFKRLKILYKKEIVPLGVAGVDATKQTGIDLSPKEWRALLKEEDLILIDNRNSFEYELGHFKGAINPGVKNFRDFAAYARENLANWQGKKVAMYCTGGIRCEKTTAWLKDLALEVYQLEGGILHYFAELPDAENEYEGNCFVFDDREVLDTKLQEVSIKKE